MDRAQCGLENVKPQKPSLSPSSSPEKVAPMLSANLRKRISRKATLTALLLIIATASAQTDKRPTIEDMHQILENAARDANRQLANTRIDDFTTLKLMTYDRGVPVMTYHYTSSALKATGQKSMTSATRKAMIDHHRAKTCSTQYVPFMRVFGLKVAHRFEDVASGLEMITVTVQASDCPRS